MTAALAPGAGRHSERPVELPALTSLRGLAALLVLLYHSSFLAANYAGAGPPGLLRRGELAVDLFFVLSGFVLTHVYGARFEKRWDWLFLARFLWARFCRLYPTSLFAAAVLLLPVAFGRIAWPAGTSLAHQIAATLFLMQVPWLDTIAINGPSWSISAEFYAYLLFPLVVPLILRLGRGSALALAVALLFAIAALRTFPGGEAPTSGWGALIRALPEFAAGIVAYRLYAERRVRGLFASDAVLLCIVAFIVAACRAGLPDGAVVPLLPLLLLAAVANRERMTRVLDLGMLRRLGDASYSVYIFQIAAFMPTVGIGIVLASHGWGGAWFILAATLLALGSGVLVHRCVDLPVRRLLRPLPERLAALCRQRAIRSIALEEPPLAKLDGGPASPAA